MDRSRLSRCCHTVLSAGAALLILSTVALAADSAPTAVEAEFQRMSKALSQRDLAVFLANGTDEAKTALTPERFAAVCDQVAARLQGGFDAVFVTQVRGLRLEGHPSGWRRRFPHQAGAGEGEGRRIPHFLEARFFPKCSDH